MAVDISGGPLPAGVNVYHSRPTRNSFGERGYTLMQLLLPAFKASVLSFAALTRLQQSMSDLIDNIELGACIVGATGEILQQNRALDSFYQFEMDRQCLRSAVARVSRNTCTAIDVSASPNSSPGNPIERITTVSRSYEIRGTRLPVPAVFPGAVGIVMVEPLSRLEAPPRDKAIQVKERFRLTERELEVALLLARRLSANEIASRLGISTHTARHHTEKIFQKTAVSSRSMIARLFEQ